MLQSLDSLLNECLALPLEQRIVLTQRLWQSMEGEVDEDAEIIAEIERREAEISSGLVKPIPFTDAMREIRESIQ